jgi:DNA-binding CsgD family transcriptional regulator
VVDEDQGHGRCSKNSLPGLLEPLTEREHEIVTYLAKGLSNHEIARQLHLAEKTIRWYNTQIYDKLDASGRKEAVARAGELGLLASPPAPGVRHTIPLQATPFVGRQRELARITSLLAEAGVRLITILAPGGMGKTRLSLEVAKARLGHDPDGVFFVPLAPLSHAADVALAIAEQIGFSFYGEDTPSHQLLNFLRDRSMLVVLNNFEHLLDAAQYVDDIIRTAPGMRIVTTSRERLQLADVGRVS